MNVVPTDVPLDARKDKSEIITIGTVNADILMGPQSPWPTPGTETVLPDSELREGGGAGNTAIALRALGARQRMICSIGNDVLGNWLREIFGPLADDWTVANVSTALTVGLNHPGGERTFFSTSGHCADFDKAAVEKVLAGIDLDGVIVLFVGPFLTPKLVPAVGDLLADIRQRGGITALDTAWPTGGWGDDVCARVSSWLGQVGILLLNDAETEGYLGVSPSDDGFGSDEITSLMPDGGIFALKQGPAGAQATQNGGAPVALSSGKIAVVDTVGAGDCFNAGFLLSYSRGGGLEECLRAGIKTAEVAISSSPRTYATADTINLISHLNYSS